jgi:TonB family protein
MRSSITDVEAPPSSFRNFELKLEQASKPDRRWWAIFLTSLAVHMGSFGIFMTTPMQFSSASPKAEPRLQKVKLYLPPDLLTQKARNRHAPSPSVNVASLMAPSTVKPQPSAPAPSVRHFEVPKTALPQTVQKTPQILAQAPVVAPSGPVNALPQGAVSGLSQPPPPPTATNQPFQNLGAEDHSDIPKRKIAVPSATVQGAVQSLTQKSNGTHLVISDQNLSEPLAGAAGSEGRGTAPHTEVELQSDPQGADFRAYLVQILSIVRANWRHVIPESARMGLLQGRTVIQFIINRDGSIPKLVTADESGSPALDRAAVAGLSMSNPLPPLPADFKGQQVRLAFTFSVDPKR